MLGGLPAGSLLEGGRTTYQHLIKIKIHFMINSLVCVPSPFKEKPPPNPLRRRGRMKPLPQPLPQGEGRSPPLTPPEGGGVKCK